MFKASDFQGKAKFTAEDFAPKPVPSVLKLPIKPEFPLKPPTVTPVDVPQSTSLLNPRKLNNKPMTDGIDLKPVNVDAITKSKPIPVSNKGVPILRGKYADKADEVAGSATSGFLDSASLGLISKGMDKLQPGITEQAREANPLAFGAGKIAGYALPATGGAKLLKPVTSKIANPLFKRVGEGMAIGAGMTGIEDTVNGKSLGETGKDMLTNAALGGALDVGLYGLGKLAGKVIGNLKVKTPVEPSIALSEPLKAETNINTPKIETKPITAEIKPINTVKDEVAAGVNLNVEGKVKPTEEIKPRSFPETVAKGDITSPELKNLIEKTDINYNSITNEDTLNFARKAIDSNYEDAIALVKSNAPATAESNAISQLLIKKLQDEGKYNDALDIIKTTAEKATSQGQAIQALSMWGRLTPEGMLRHIQNTFNKANNEVKIKGLKSPKLEITPELQKDVFDRMTKINEMPEGREKMIEIAKVLRDVDAKLPKSATDKLGTYQTIAQLLNPKTITRNIIGNAIFGGLENISNVIGTPIDAVVSKLFKTQRTTLLPSLKTQFKAGLQGGKNSLEEALQGIDLTRMGNKFELGHGKTFNGGVMGALETATNVGLRVPDAAFSEAARAESLRQMMKITGAKEPTPGMIELADKLADYRTFQDTNGLSEGLKSVKQGLNKLSSYFTGTDKYGLGDLVIRYTKTPANILARGIEYSPVGVVNAITKAASPLRGKVFNQKEFVDSLSRGMTGTGLIFAGYELNKLGIVTGSPDKDKDVANLKRDMGNGEYRINTTALQRWLNSKNPNDAKPKNGDTFVSWDWAQPSSIVFTIGANIAQSNGNAEDLFTTAADAVASGVNTILDQPLLTGIKKLTGGSNLAQSTVSTIAGMPGSLTPTLFKQVAQTTDNVRRNTYDPNQGKQALNLVTAKIPGLSNKLQPQISTLGDTRLNYDTSGVKKGLDIFLNPAFHSKYNSTPATDLIMDIYYQSGDKIQFPRVADKSFSYKGQKLTLTPKELTDMQQYLGQRTNQYFDVKAKDSSFMNKSPEDKAKELQKVLNTVYDESKKRILEGRGIK